MNRTFHIHDATLSVSAELGKNERSPHLYNPDWETYNRIKDALAALGFVIGKDPRIEKDYPSLSKTHDAGRHGALEFVSSTYNTGCKFEFFQNIVFENRNGGKYDFNRLQKMPYLVRLRWQHTMIALRKHLISRGFAERVKIHSPNPDPLAYFTQRWGSNRFPVGPDGWPSDEQLKSWPPFDRDGTRIRHGEVRYFRDRKGHLMRGRVYDGINGNWMVVYGPGQQDYTFIYKNQLFTCNPSETPRKIYCDRERRLKGLLEDSVKAQNFERAIIFRDLLKVPS